ncbi:hypothetical protein COO60DRAFT_1646717 [Scenedesmus sp. NREL 46B-D3]|nr:hypothetical protein COO60DRAFT_1646717 [Scenedesmus sp. NREL 46B-D3]
MQQEEQQDQQQQFNPLEELVAQQLDSASPQVPASPHGRAGAQGQQLRVRMQGRQLPTQRQAQPQDMQEEAAELARLTTAALTASSLPVASSKAALDDALPRLCMTAEQLEQQGGRKQQLATQPQHAQQAITADLTGAQRRGPRLRQQVGGVEVCHRALPVWVGVPGTGTTVAWHQLSIASESAASFLQHTCWQGLNLDPHMAQQLNAHGTWVLVFLGAACTLYIVFKWLLPFLTSKAMRLRIRTAAYLVGLLVHVLAGGADGHPVLLHQALKETLEDRETALLQLQDSFTELESKYTALEGRYNDKSAKLSELELLLLKSSCDSLGPSEAPATQPILCGQDSNQSVLAPVDAANITIAPTSSSTADATPAARQRKLCDQPQKAILPRDSTCQKKQQQQQQCSPAAPLRTPAQPSCKPAISSSSSSSTPSSSCRNGKSSTLSTPSSSSSGTSGSSSSPTSSSAGSRGISVAQSPVRSFSLAGSSEHATPLAAGSSRVNRHKASAAAAAVTKLLASLPTPARTPADACNGSELADKPVWK